MQRIQIGFYYLDKDPMTLKHGFKYICENCYIETNDNLHIENPDGRIRDYTQRRCDHCQEELHWLF